MDVVKTVLVAILSAGGAVFVWNLFRGLDLWRNGTARTEARGIQNLEKWGGAAERREADALHREAFYRDDQGPYLRARIGDLEHVIRVELGPDRIPPASPPPVMTPVPSATGKAVVERE